MNTPKPKEETTIHPVSGLEETQYLLLLEAEEHPLEIDDAPKTSKGIG